jgi:hypothetical protein
MPLDGEPVDVVAYDKWLTASTGVPKLLLTFDPSPALMVTPEIIAWCPAVLAGGEAACGAKKLGIPRPAFRLTSADEIASVMPKGRHRLGLFRTGTRWHLPQRLSRVRLHAWAARTAMTYWCPQCIAAWRLNRRRHEWA